MSGVVTSLPVPAGPETAWALSRTERGAPSIGTPLRVATLVQSVPTTSVVAGGARVPGWPSAGAIVLARHRWAAWRHREPGNITRRGGASGAVGPTTRRV